MQAQAFAFCAVLLLVGAFPAAHGMSETSWGKNITFKGFATLGAARTNERNLQPIRDFSMPVGFRKHWTFEQDSVLGAQMNVALGESDQAVLQGVSRYRYDGSFRPDITWAYLRHDFTPNLILRAGRLGLEFYLFSDTRLVGYSYVTVRPPPDYYAMLPIYYFDGADLGGAMMTSLGTVRGKVFAGHLADKIPFYSGRNWDWKGSRALGGYLELDRGAWQLRLSRIQLRLKNEQPVNEIIGFDFLSLAPELRAAGQPIDYTSLGVAYDQGPFMFQAMVSRSSYRTAALEDMTAAYALAAYRVGQFTPFAGYSWARSSPDALSDSRPPAVKAIAKKMIAYTHTHQQSVFLGARWDFQRNMAFKAQADFMRGRPDSLLSFRDDGITPWNGHSNIYSLSLDVIF